MQLTRSELYNRVCEAPLSRLAPEFGLTGTALAAICRQHEIPYPGSGYWTRKSLGIAAELPALPDGIDAIIEITPVAPKPREKKASATETDKRLKAKPVAKTRRLEHHPLLVGAEAHLRKSRTAKDGEFLRPYKRILPDVISSEASLARALSIANHLYLATSHSTASAIVCISHQLEKTITAFISRSRRSSARTANTAVTIQVASGDLTGRRLSTSTPSRLASLSPK